MIGIALGLLRPQPLPETVAAFLELRAEHPLAAAELHLETQLYPAAMRLEVSGDHLQVRQLRRKVEILGVHLPFMAMDPLSPSPTARLEAHQRLRNCLLAAARLEADYAVCHCRSGHDHNTTPTGDTAKLWQPLVDDLAEQAEKCGISFCLENADSLRRPAEIQSLIAACPSAVGSCLDVGHLYERIYPPQTWRRRALYYFDRYAPRPFAIRTGLPLEKWGEWPQVLCAMRPSPTCIHLHNHNGRSAHQLLSRGAIDLRPLGVLSDLIQNIPLIIESDYRLYDLAAVKKDIRMLEEMITNGR